MPPRREGERGKMLLVHLDGEGCAYLSEGAFRDLEWARRSGLSPHQVLVLNVLPDPPPLTVVMPDPTTGVAPEVRSHMSPRNVQQVGEALVDVAPDRKNVVVHWDRRKAYA